MGIPKPAKYRRGARATESASLIILIPTHTGRKWVKRRKQLEGIGAYQCQSTSKDIQGNTISLPTISEGKEVWRLPHDGNIAVATAALASIGFTYDVFHNRSEDGTLRGRVMEPRCRADGSLTQLTLAPVNRSKQSALGYLALQSVAKERHAQGYRDKPTLFLLDVVERKSYLPVFLKWEQESLLSAMEYLTSPAVLTPAQQLVRFLEFLIFQELYEKRKVAAGTRKNARLNPAGFKPATKMYPVGADKNPGRNSSLENHAKLEGADLPPIDGFIR